MAAECFKLTADSVIGCLFDIMSLHWSPDIRLSVPPSAAGNMLYVCFDAFDLNAGVFRSRILPLKLVLNTRLTSSNQA